jgi:MipA family protein
MINAQPRARALSMLALAMLTGAPVLAAQASKPQDGEAGAFTITTGAEYSTSSLTGGVRTRPRWSPLLDIEYTRGRFFLSTGRGLGYNVVQSDVFTLGVGAAYNPKRKAADDPRLRGLGDVAASPLVLLTADWNPAGDFIHVYASYTGATKRANGSFLTVGTTVGFPLFGKLNGFVDLSAVIADRNYMQTYYGITAAQSATSGYAVFTPRAGLVNASLSLGLDYELSKEWSLGASVGRTRLTRDAAKSPIFPRRDEPDGSVFASYTF